MFVIVLCFHKYSGFVPSFLMFAVVIRSTKPTPHIRPRPSRPPPHAPGRGARLCAPTPRRIAAILLSRDANHCKMTLAPVAAAGTFPGALGRPPSYGKHCSLPNAIRQRENTVGARRHLVPGGRQGRTRRQTGLADGGLPEECARCPSRRKGSAPKRTAALVADIPAKI